MLIPIPQPDFTPLREFRQQSYDACDHCKDAFFELLDAVIQTRSARSFAELSLAPACQHQWPSLYKAIEQVSYKQQTLDELCLERVPTDQVALFAIDAGEHPTDVLADTQRSLLLSRRGARSRRARCGHRAALFNSRLGERAWEQFFSAGQHPASQARSESDRRRCRASVLARLLRATAIRVAGGARWRLR